MGPLGKLVAAGVAVTIWMLLAAGLTAASTTHDLRGTWSCCGSGGAGAQTFVITSMNLGSGKFSGHGGGGGITYPITGQASGTSVTLTTGPYNQLKSYTAIFKGKVSANGKTMSGSWTSNASQSGTWTATRTSAPPKPKKPKKPKHKKPKALCKVPKLKGDTLAAAKRALSRAHCAAGRITRKKSAKVGKQRVIASSPGQGSKRKSGTRVTLTVSRGKH